MPLTDPDASNFEFKKNPKSSKQCQGKHNKNRCRSLGSLESLDYHLIHLNNHFNHLNHRIGLQDLLQRWQNNAAKFCKHCRKLEANPDARAEVFHSSSVMFTVIQVQPASIPVFLMSCQVSCQPNPCDACASNRGFLKVAIAFLLPNHWMELHSV